MNDEKKDDKPAFSIPRDAAGNLDPDKAAPGGYNLPVGTGPTAEALAASTVKKDKEHAGKSDQQADSTNVKGHGDAGNKPAGDNADKGQKDQKDQSEPGKHESTLFSPDVNKPGDDKAAAPKPESKPAQADSQGSLNKAGAAKGPTVKAK